MKFIVNELPYYEEYCPLYAECWDTDCPRFWTKDKVCSDDNQHKCLFLIEAGKYKERT